MKKLVLIVLGIIALIAVITAISRGGNSSTPAAGSAAPTSDYVAAAPSPAAPMHSAADGVGDGVYQVGADLPAGRYKTDGPPSTSAMPMCYWQRSKDDSGSFDSIIANDNIQGPGSVSVKAGEFVKFSGGCDWKKA